MRLARLAFIIGPMILWVACGAAPPPTTPEEPEEPPPPTVVALRLAEAPDAGPEQTPQTRILLVLIDPDQGRTTTELGLFDGACTPLEPPDGALLAARCWWGQAQAEVVVRRREGVLVATRGLGDAQEEVARVEVPPEIRVEGLGGR